MNRLFFFSILIFCLIGCKKNNNRDIQIKENSHYKEIDFLNNDFKIVIDSFIRDIHIYPVHQYEDILVYFSLSKSDTVLSLMNCPPYEEDNLKTVNQYKGYNLYFYSPQILDDKMKKLIGNIDKKPIKIDTSYISSIYQTSYFVNGKKIEFIEVPLEWSTDSISTK